MDTRIFRQARCPLCGTPNEPMGQLGSLVHYRCRACGMMFSRSVR